MARRDDLPALLALVTIRAAQTAAAQAGVAAAQTACDEAQAGLAAEHDRQAARGAG